MKYIHFKYLFSTLWWDETEPEQIDQTIKKWSIGINLMITYNTWLLFFVLMQNQILLKREPTTTEAFHNNYQRTNKKSIKGQKYQVWICFEPGHKEMELIEMKWYAMKWNRIKWIQLGRLGMELITMQQYDMERDGR